MQRGDKRDRWRSFSSTVLQIARSATVDGFFERFRFVATCRISFPEERTGQRVTVRVGSGPDRVCIPEKSRFFPLPFSIAAAMLARATRGWRGILVCGRGGRIIECTLTRHPVSRLYSLPDNYNDNEASDDGRRWPAHTRPCSLLFILRSLPPILSPRLSALLSEFAGILLVGNFFIQHANLARRNIITPLCFNGAPLCLITTHRYESLEKRCVMYRVTTGHRRISERFSATGIVIRP